MHFLYFDLRGADTANKQLPHFYFYFIVHISVSLKSLNKIKQVKNTFFANLWILPVFFLLHLPFLTC